MNQLRHGSLFSGMGGFDLAARWMNWKNVFHCERDPFASKILKHHFPESISYHDIKETDFSVHANAIDIISGGFPCQPFSTAGKRKGKDDDRHLWPWMLGAIRDVKPPWVVGENVLGLVNWSGGLVFEEVQSDLETEGYEVQTFVLPACSVDAPHRRDRCWIVAYSESNRMHRKERIVCKENGRPVSGMLSEYDQSSNRFGTSGIVSNTSSEFSSLPVQQRRQDKAKDTDINRKGGSGVITDSSSLGRVQQWEGKSIRNEDRNNTHEESGRIEFQDGFGGGLEREIISDTESTRLEGRNGSQGSVRSEQGGQEGYWETWPTQSPLCNGDDGISSRLDASAVFNRVCKPNHARPFPKWRNESIRCGGNAVVPQAPYQIFKAIQEYENMMIKE